MNIKEALEEFNFFNEGDYITKNMSIAKDVVLTAYEKEKEKNKELSNSYDILAKECNEENRRCMLLAVENQDLKEKNKKLNILRLELLISQFPDTTETYKKYKKELDELLKEE
jgi:hypothetical protein